MTAHPHFQKLVEKVRLLPPLASAVVYPCDRDALQLALSGEFAGYLTPTLVGPEARIRDVAAKAGLDISRLSVVDTPDDPRAAADEAVALARRRTVSALVKGSLGVDVLLSPVVAHDSGLRTARRLTHAYFLDFPGIDRGVLLADGQLNVAPNLAAKHDIVHNTVAFAQALAIAAPKVALIAGMIGASPAFPSTTEALALRAMAERGIFPGAQVDGPLTPDVALSAEIARTAGNGSPVAGAADVLIAPTMEAALILLRTLALSGRGLAAGLVLGARVPIVIPGRLDSMEVRMASCVLASLAAAGHAQDAGAAVPGTQGAAVTAA